MDVCEHHFSQEVSTVYAGRGPFSGGHRVAPASQSSGVQLLFTENIPQTTGLGPWRWAQMSRIPGPCRDRHQEALPAPPGERRGTF